MGGECTTPNGGCCAGESDHYELEVFLKRTKAYRQCELDSTPIEIGENGFVSPHLRYAMLQEDFSHIYDQRFAETNTAPIVKLQAIIRAF